MTDRTRKLLGKAVADWTGRMRGHLNAAAVSCVQEDPPAWDAIRGVMDAIEGSVGELKKIGGSG